MKKMIGKCGFVCEDCPAYSKNIKNEIEKVDISKKWLEIFDFAISPNAIRCDGCRQSTQLGHEILHLECEIRKCAEERNLEYCFNCDMYICDNLDKYLGEYESLAKDLREKISEDDLRKFLKPHLDAREIFKNQK